MRLNFLKMLPNVLAFSIAVLPGVALATYSCTGPVTYLGIDGGGDVTLALSGATPIHKICNLNSQGGFVEFSVASCKVAYAAALTAHATGKTLTVFYDDNLTCATQPYWGEALRVYFVQGPD